jgi:hypothetical protein
MNSDDVMQIFEALIALALIGLVACGVMQSKIAAKLQRDYPAESARLGMTVSLTTRRLSGW